MYQEAGIGVTVVRSGKYKALANSVEPLSKEGEAQLQGMVDATSKVFTRHVSQMRGRTEDYVDANMGQGREFIGAQASDVGLVDGITTMDALLAKLQRQYIDTPTGRLDTQSKQVGGFGANADTENTMLTQEQIDKLKKEQGAGTASASTSQEQTQEPTASTQDVATSESESTLSTLLAKAQDEVVDLRVKLATAEAAATSALALLDPMKAVMAQSISNMRIALGGVAVSADLPAAELIAMHGSVSEEFTKKFPVGGVAAVNAAQGDTKTKAAPLSGLEAARLNAVLNKK